MQSGEQKKYKLINGPIARQLILFALPIVFTSILQQLYHMADGIIVGKFIGENALTGVSQSEKVINVLLALFMGTSVGAGVIISQYFGFKDGKNLSKAVHNTIILSVVFGAVMTVAGFFAAPQILKLMNVNPEHMAYSVSYLRIYFLGVVFMFVFNMGSGILRAVGDSISPLIFLGGSAALNVGLDILFVGELNMGISGAAWATFICQAIAATGVLLRLFLSKREYKLSFKGLRFNSKMCGKIVKIGIPTGLQNSIISVAHIVMAYFINQFGPNAANGAALYGKIDGFLYLPFSCLALALSTFVGQNVGAGKYDRAKKSVIVTILIGECITIVLGLTVFFSARPIMYLIGGSDASVPYGMTFMYVLVLSYPILVINDALAGAIRGAGQAIIPAAILIGGMCGLRIAFISVGMQFYSNVIIVFLSYPVSWVFTTTLLTIYFFKGKWLKRVIKPEAPPQAAPEPVPQVMSETVPEITVGITPEALPEVISETITEAAAQETNAAATQSIIK